MKALSTLAASLPGDFPAPIFVVQHMAAETTGKVLVDVLGKRGALLCKQAEDGEKIRSGRIYVAVPDHHMLISGGRIIISKGARENRSRPAIDPLFRSAAVESGSSVIGIVLTGFLNDGASGLAAVQRCGGVCIVQDPKDAEYPEMPASALDKIKADFCLPVSAIGACLAKLVAGPVPKRISIPDDIAMEAKIAERVNSDVAAVEKLGEQVPFNCPNCGGVLWEIAKGSILRYRCHTGHAYTSMVLETAQTKKIEETLWVALRMLEERKNLFNKLAEPQSAGYLSGAREKAKESEVHINRIRAILLRSFGRGKTRPPSAA